MAFISLPFVNCANVMSSLPYMELFCLIDLSHFREAIPGDRLVSFIKFCNFDEITIGNIKKNNTCKTKSRHLYHLVLTLFIYRGHNAVGIYGLLQLQAIYAKKIWQM